MMCMPLTPDAKATLERRKAVGVACLSFTDEGNDPETAASDAISDILTELFGPAGTYGEDYRTIKYNDEALENARALLDRALRSYAGDAEDYTRMPVPETA
jgi:hypothetical protein